MRSALFCSLLAVSLCGCQTATTSIFPFSQGWLGADGDSSIAIAPGRSLWFFDDTFVGAATQTSRPGSTFVHNTIGVSSGDPLTGKWTVQYFWQHQGTPSPTPMFDSPQIDAQQGWYWPSDAALLGGRVYVALEGNIATPGQNLGFASVGSTLAAITNPTAPPDQWSIQYTVLPLPATCFPGAAMTPDAPGTNLLLYTSCDNPNPQAWQKPVFLLRIPVSGLADPVGNLQYLAADGTWQAGAPANISAATIVMPAGHTEFTVRYHPELNEWVAIMILPGAFFTNQFALLTAPAAEGPWAAPVGVFTYPEMTPGSKQYVDSNTFCYAAKEHVELEVQGSGKLVASYACNDSLSVVASDPNLYVPRLVEIPAPAAR